jgi:DNA-binding PadR family transcriptional regulator
MLYPVLHRLEREGLIEAVWRSVDGRRRKYYALTEQGNQALAAERDAWESVNLTLARAWEGAA